MFTNEQLRNEEAKLKLPRKRAEYSRTYNQKPYRQEYLKACSQVRRLVAKYNPAYQNKRKGDRHKLDSKTRYRLKKITLRLAQNNFYPKPFSYFPKNGCNGG